MVGIYRYFGGSTVVTLILLATLNFTQFDEKQSREKHGRGGFFSLATKEPTFCKREGLHSVLKTE